MHSILLEMYRRRRTARRSRARPYQFFRLYRRRYDTLQFTFSGAGTIGVTPNLTLNVTNSAGEQIASAQCGPGLHHGQQPGGDGNPGATGCRHGERRRFVQ